jgi:para-nitrobenzyl esterase
MIGMALLMTEVEGGLVEGLPGHNQSISVFKGIPFAKSPEGELRWKRPQPAEPWEGILKAYKYPDICTQLRYPSEGGTTLAAREFYVVEFPMSEDCLKLNVYTPAKSADEKLPVAIYIHGGGFDTGYSFLNAYDGESFAKKGIVTVMIPYRLNIFGFFAHQELAEEDPDGSTGNYGTMDQIAAIQWVIRNISAFGGDPENISLFGQSAGGMSVENMCASPLIKGAFKRAIMQSGGGLCKGGSMEHFNKDEAMALGDRFLKFSGYKSISELRKLSDLELLDIYKSFKEEIGEMIVFFPSIDGYALTEKTSEYFRKGNQPDIEYMIGCTSDEMRNKNAKAPSFDKIKEIAEKNYGEKSQKYLEAIEAESPEKAKMHFENVLGDEMLAGDLAWCENQLDLGRKPSYMYYFTYVPPGAEDVGAHHSVEHHYVFKTLNKSYRPYSGNDYELAEVLNNYWVNFIKTGDPNIEGEKKWTPYTKESPKVLEIGNNLEMKAINVNSKIKFIKDFSLGKL